MRNKWIILLTVFLAIIIVIYFILQKNVFEKSDHKYSKEIADLSNEMRQRKINKNASTKKFNVTKTAFCKEFLSDFPLPEHPIDNISDAGDYISKHMLPLYKKDIEKLDYNDPYALIKASIKKRLVF